MTEQQIPGDVIIKTVSIFVQQGIVNLVELVKMMSIYESIITPGIIVDLTIDDTRNLLTNLPILGGERVVVEIMAPGRNTRSIELVVGAVIDPMPSDNMRVKRYTLQCVTPEVIQSKSIQITKSYNTNISNIVKDICSTYLQTKKTLDIQQTKGVQQFIVGSKQPFVAIDKLRKYSIASEDKSSMFVFFENADGYHYKTIESLFSGDAGDRVFSNDQTLHTDIESSTFRNVLNYDQPNQFDLAKRMHTGGLAHEIKSFDFKTLSYKSVVSKFASEVYKAADGAMKDPDNQRTKALYGNSAGTNSWVFNDTGRPNTFISDGLGARQNILGLMGQGFLHLHVFGDSELTAGQLIDINLLDNTAGTMNPSLHPQLSGKYVIAFIRHIIMPEGNNPRYTCTIEALKGGYKESV